VGERARPRTEAIARRKNLLVAFVVSDTAPVDDNWHHLKVFLTIIIGLLHALMDGNQASVFVDQPDNVVCQYFRNILHEFLSNWA